MAPLHKIGDEHGAVLKDAAVTMPPGWKEVYRHWIEGGWSALTGPEEYGGQDLPVMLTVNGEVKQQSTTGQMIYGVAEIIAHLSTIMTLSPGDLIGTGTAAGVGHGRKPPEYLKPGDEVRMEIGSLGMLVTPVV